jgi:hypothetical protein
MTTVCSSDFDFTTLNNEVKSGKNCRDRIRRGSYENELENIMTSINLIELTVEEKKEGKNRNSCNNDYIPNPNDLKVLPNPPIIVNNNTPPILIPAIPLVESPPLEFIHHTFSYNTPSPMLNYEPPPSPPRYCISIHQFYLFYLSNI